jgi:hypothetical protein
MANWITPGAAVMFSDAVQDFIKRAAGLIQIYIDATTRDRQYFGSSKNEQKNEFLDLLPVGLEFSASKINLIKDFLLGSIKFDNFNDEVAPNLKAGVPVLAVFKYSKPLEGTEIEYFHSPNGYESYQFPQLLTPVFRSVEHGEMIQIDVNVTQSNTLMDSDIMGAAASNDMVIKLDNTQTLTSTVSSILNKPIADGNPVIIGASTYREEAAIPSTAPLAYNENELSNSAIVASTGFEIGVLAVMGDVNTSTTVMQLNASLQRIDANYGSQNTYEEINLSNLTVSAGNTNTNDIVLSINIVEGNFIDFMKIKQVQLLDDRDVIGWSKVAEYQNLITGQNSIGNDLILKSTELTPELLIIGGNYYSHREIIQVNISDNLDSVLHEDDYLFEHSPNESNLFNSATIASPTQSLNQPEMTDEVSEIFLSILNGHEIDIDKISHWDFDDDGKVEALVVRGDYIDVKSIRQVNILADADLVLGIKNDKAPITDEVVPIIKGNSLSNEAIIFDAAAGAREAFINGNFYNNQTLLDANLLGDVTSEVYAGVDDANLNLSNYLEISHAAMANEIFFDAPAWGN